jgi:hypothetical protein
MSPKFEEKVQKSHIDGFFFSYRKSYFLPSNFQPYNYDLKVQNRLTKNKTYDRKERIHRYIGPYKR